MNITANKMKDLTKEITKLIKDGSIELIKDVEIIKDLKNIEPITENQILIL